jgi:predicted PurR-regulated permease PerM
MNKLHNPLTRAENPSEENRAAMFTIGALIGLFAGALVGLLRFLRLKSDTPNAVPSPPHDDEITPLTVSQPNSQGLPTETGKGQVKPSSRTQPQAATKISDQALYQKDASTSWSKTTKYIVGVGLFLAIVLIVYASRGSLSLIIFAALIAFIVSPLTHLFQNRLKMKRGLATILTYLLVLAALVMIPVLILPGIIDAVNSIISLDFQAIAQTVSETIQNTARDLSTIPLIGPSISSSLDTLARAIENLFGLETPEPISVDVSITSIGGRLASTLGALVQAVGPVVTTFISFVFMILISLHMSLAAEQIRQSYLKLVPPAYEDEISDLIQRISNIWTSFLRGQLTLMIIIGLLVYILNLILGTPYALFLGFVSGMLEIIPSLGPFLALFPATFVALVFGSNHFDISPALFALVVIIGYSLIQVLENQLIVPKVLGEAVDLPPLVVILGVTIFGSLFGILGVFLATPVIATGREVFSYLYDKILEPPVVEEPPEEKPSLLDKIRGYFGRIRLPFRRRQPPLETVENIPKRG